jgi:hypothetical protein
MLRRIKAMRRDSRLDKPSPKALHQAVLDEPLIC